MSKTKEVNLSTVVFLAAVVAIIAALGTATLIANEGTGAPTGFVTGTTTATVASVTTITLPNWTMNFGAKLIGENMSTVNFTTQPFVLQNDGNVWLNVSINSTALFNIQTSPSLNFQFNSTYNTSTGGGVGGCVNWSGNNFASSSTGRNWTFVPMNNGSGSQSGCGVGGDCGPVWAIVGMNYAASDDSCIVHINVTIPDFEPQGFKQASVTFTAVQY